MLIKQLLENSTKKDFMSIAPDFHKQHHNRYANVVKFIKILAHAEGIDYVKVAVTVGSKEVKFAILAAEEKEIDHEKTMAEKDQIFKNFWSKVATYFASIKNHNTVFGRYVNLGGKERIPISPAAVVSYIAKHYLTDEAERRVGYYTHYTPLEIAVENSTEKVEDEHDYDAILKDLKKGKPKR